MSKGYTLKAFNNNKKRAASKRLLASVREQCESMKEAQDYLDMLLKIKQILN